MAFRRKNMSKTSRREFLISSAPLLTAPLLLPIISGSAMGSISSATAARDMQPFWRFCTKCNSLFFHSRDEDVGKCAAGGGHSAAGYVFQLPYNTPGTPTAQSNWRFCGSCTGLFWNGYPDKGRCSAGGPHKMYGFDYVIPHDIAPNGNNQDKWRFCDKCKAMFYDGYPAKGSCPAGGGHNAAGYMFVLPHLPDASAQSSELKLRSNVTTDGWAPIGGWVELIARPGGGCEFAGHIHNSGAINIRFTLGAVLVTPKGYSYGFAMSNKRVDGTEVLIGRNRDFDWRNNADWAHWLDRVSAGGNFIGTARYAADYWPDVSKSVLAWKLVASSAVGSGVTSFLENIVIDAYRYLPNLGITKEVLVGRPLQLVLSL
jgi:hypothetical protein